MDRLDKRIERKEDRIAELEDNRDGFNLRVFLKEFRLSKMEYKRAHFPISLRNEDLHMLYPSARLWLAAMPHAIHSFFIVTKNTGECDNEGMKTRAF